MTTSNQPQAAQPINIDAIIESELGEISRNLSWGNNSKRLPFQEIKIFPNYVKTKVNGIEKDISILDFKTIFDSLFDIKETSLVNYALPYNCFVFGRDMANMELSCYYPERKVNVEHMERHGEPAKKYTIPFPNTIINHRLTLEEGFWKVHKSNYFCTEKLVTQLPDNTHVTVPDTRNGIWSMPFPNFYREGAMCYGKNTMPLRYTNNLRGLDYFYQVIFSAPFNNDLGLNHVSTTTSPKIWFQQLSELEKFPYDLLKK